MMDDLNSNLECAHSIFLNKVLFHQYQVSFGGIEILYIEINGEMRGNERVLNITQSGKGIDR